MCLKNGNLSLVEALAHPSKAYLPAAPHPGDGHVWEPSRKAGVGVGTADGSRPHPLEAGVHTAVGQSLL